MGGTTGGTTGTNGGATGVNGGAGGTGGSSASSSSAGIASSVSTAANSSIASTPAKVCGACPAVESETECLAAANRCEWSPHSFAFLRVLFGASGGTCDMVPECTTSTSSASSSASLQAAASSRLSSSSSARLRIIVGGISVPQQCGDRVVQAERGEECEPGLIENGQRVCTLSCLWEQCPPGETIGTDGRCTDLPACPTADVSANATSLHLSCVNACASSPDSAKCSAACVCNCRPGAPPKAMEAAGSCVSSCLRGGGAATACEGRTGEALAQCCMTSCIGFACPFESTEG